MTIDPTTVSTHTISVHGAYQGLVTGTYTVNRAGVQMTPSHPFFPGELVQSTVTTHTRSITGTAITNPIVWQFRTKVDAGFGIFGMRKPGLDSTWSTDIALGDLDSDGDLDIFLAHRDEANTIWFNNGVGQFTASESDYSTPSLIDLSLGDLDKDGDLDALLTGIQDDRILWNNGHGVFSYGGETLPPSAIIVNLVLGDLDGDSDLDAVAITACDPFDDNQNCMYATNDIWWNDGAGNFQLSGQYLGFGTDADAALGDLDGDGDLDAMVVSPIRAWMVNPIRGSSVWTNLGSGIFTSTQKLDNLLAASVDFGDLDSDGDLDAFATSLSASSSTIWLNDGSGIFTPGQYLEAHGSARLGDLDGDGDLDAFLANDGADTIWLNRGDGTFVSSGQKLGTLWSTSVALGDIDGDGDLDAITSGYFAEPILWVNEFLTLTWLPVMTR